MAARTAIRASAAVPSGLPLDFPRPAAARIADSPGLLPPRTWVRVAASLLSSLSVARATWLRSRSRTARCAVSVVERTEATAKVETNEKAEVEAPSEEPEEGEYLAFLPPLLVFLVSDQALKFALKAQGVTFPSPLVGLFVIFVSLLALDAVDTQRCKSVTSFFNPAVGFIQRWLPLFYVPPLVTLPLAVQGLSAVEGAKLLLIVAPGMVASLWFTGLAVTSIRNITNTELLPYEVKPPLPPFASSVLQAWLAIAALGMALIAVAPSALGSSATTAAPALLGCTVVGLIVGSGFPADVRRILHPIITCALFGEAGTWLYSLVTGTPFLDVLRVYTTKDLFGTPGAGDLFMSFLGSVILSFAFSMFNQRALIQRHYREIFGGVLLSALFSMFSTAAAGNLLGLGPELTLTVVPRCITVALAMPMATLLGVPDTSITAAAVVLTGLIGANFAQLLLDTFGYKDPIVRGISTASSSHGLGTAALAAKEPEALSFCAIAYALTGITSSVLVTVPTVRETVLAVAGAS